MDSKNTLSALHRSLDEEVGCQLSMTADLVQTCRGGKTVFYSFSRLGQTGKRSFSAATSYIELIQPETEKDAKGGT